MPEGGSGVDAVPRAGEIGLEEHVGGRVAERSAALIARDDRAVELVRTPEETRRARHVALGDRGPHHRGRHTLEFRNHDDVEAEALEQLEISRTTDAEAKVGSSDDRFRTDRLQVLLREPLGWELLQRRVEAGEEGRLDPGLADQLEAALEGRDQLDAVPEGDPWMRVERDHRRREPGSRRGLEHRQVPAMDTVEAADGDRARRPHHLPGSVRDVHANRASASSGGITCRSSASSTPNGPIAVLLRETQW